jgi:hypothetical protein
MRESGKNYVSAFSFASVCVWRSLLCHLCCVTDDRKLSV